MRPLLRQGFGGQARPRPPLARGTHVHAATHVGDLFQERRWGVAGEIEHVETQA